MDKYEYSKEKDKCAYWIASVRSCRECLFETLCKLEKQKLESSQPSKAES